MKIDILFISLRRKGLPFALFLYIFIYKCWASALFSNFQYNLEIFQFYFCVYWFTLFRNYVPFVFYSNAFFFYYWFCKIIQNFFQRVVKVKSILEIVRVYVIWIFNTCLKKVELRYFLIFKIIRIIWTLKTWTTSIA